MAASSVLVNAAFLEAKTRAGATVPDTSSISKGQIDVSRTYLKGIEGVFKNIKEKEEALEAAKNTQLRAFKAAAKRAATHILKDEASQPMKIHGVIFDKFKAMEEEFMLYNTTGDDDTADNEKMRANLYAQLQMITNQAVKSRGTIATKATMANDLLANEMTVEEIAVAKAIMSVDGNYDNIELSFNEKGQLVYHVLLEGMDDVVSWTIEDFEREVRIHDKNIDLYAKKGENASYKMGYETEKDYDDDTKATDKNDFLENVIQNDEGNLKDAMWSKINGKKSWRKALLENTNIAKAAVEFLFKEDMKGKIVLAEVDGEGGITFADMDTDDSRTITEADLLGLSDEQKGLWQMNIVAMVDALTKVDHSAFNFERSSDALADYFVGGLEDKFIEGRDDKIPEITELTQTEIENIAKRDMIVDLVSQDPANITLSDINKIKLRSGYQIVRERGNYVVYQQTTTARSEVEKFSINDMESLRTALYNYSGVSQTYRTFGKLSKFETTTIPFKKGYEFKTGGKDDRPVVEY